MFGAIFPFQLWRTSVTFTLNKDSLSRLCPPVHSWEIQEPRLERPNRVQTIKKQSWFVTVAGDKSSLQQLQKGPSDKEETTHSGGPDWSQMGWTIWINGSLIHILLTVSYVWNKGGGKRRKKRVNAQLESYMTKQKVQCGWTAINMQHTHSARLNGQPLELKVTWVGRPATERRRLQTLMLMAEHYPAD